MFMSNFSRLPLSGERKADKCTRSFADIPFHRVKAGATIRNVCSANVFAGRDQILYTDRKQGSERNLERKAASIDVICPPTEDVNRCGSIPHNGVRINFRLAARSEFLNSI